MESAEADDGVAGCRVPDVVRIERTTFVGAFADRDERRDIGSLQLGLSAKPPQRIALPGGQIHRPCENVGECCGFIREVILLRVHVFCPDPARMVWRAVLP